MRKRSEAADPKPDPATSTRVDAEPPAPEKKAPGPPRAPFSFPSAHKAKVSRVREDLERIVETQHVNDIHETYRELEHHLEVGEKRSEHAHAVLALDKAPGRAFLAHRAYLTARAIYKAWELDNEVTFAAMWSEATRSLQAEKDTGVRSKQITDADIRSRVAALYPDDYKAQELTRLNIEQSVKMLEKLAEIWMGKQADLRALVGKLR